MYRISFAIALGLCSISGCADSGFARIDNASNSVPMDRSVDRPAGIPTPTPEQRAAAKPDQSRYQSKPDYEGLYYFVHPKQEDERKLIISFTNEPIPQKPNDPDEVTQPGFYLSHFNRLDFSDIEVVGKRISFKTRPVADVIYEFKGVIKEEIDPNFDPNQPIPGITGVLKTIRLGRVLKEETVTLGHAVIA